MTIVKNRYRNVHMPERNWKYAAFKAEQQEKSLLPPLAA
jgi:hypothetical protein